MKRISTTLVAGLLIAGLFAPTQLLAQESELALRSEPAKAPKLTLNSVAAQVTTLQTQVNSLQSTVNSLQTTVSSLQKTVSSLQPYFAVVDKDATVVRESPTGEVGAIHHGIGSYSVFFNKDVANCAYVATIGNAGTGAPPSAQVSVESSSGNEVDIRAQDNTGKDVDSPFHLSVMCP